MQVFREFREILQIVSEFMWFLWVLMWICIINTSLRIDRMPYSNTIKFCELFDFRVKKYLAWKFLLALWANRSRETWQTHKFRNFTMNFCELLWILVNSCEFKQNFPNFLRKTATFVVVDVGTFSTTFRIFEDNFRFLRKNASGRFHFFWGHRKTLISIFWRWIQMFEERVREDLNFSGP